MALRRRRISFIFGPAEGATGMPAKKKAVSEEFEAKLATLSAELTRLKAAYFGAAVDELQRPAGPFHLLTVRTAGTPCAVPLWAVEGVSWAVTPTEDARLKPPYAGWVNYHGELVPVLELGAALGAEWRGVTARDQLIYIAAAGRKTALAVEAALEVEAVDGPSIVMAGEAGLRGSLFWGVVERSGETLRILDPGALTAGFKTSAAEAAGA